MSPPTAFSYRQATCRITLPVGIRRPGFGSGPRAVRLLPTYRDPALESSVGAWVRHETSYLDHRYRPGARDRATRPARDEADQAAGLSSRTMRLPAPSRSCATVLTSSCRRAWRMDTGGVARTCFSRSLRPARSGDWSYEVVDTKLARETKGGTILQLCLYSDLVPGSRSSCPIRCTLSRQGARLSPSPFGRTTTWRTIATSAAAFSGVSATGPSRSLTYPEPVEQCEICRWWQRCDDRRRRDDHLSLVAGVSTLQRRELEIAAGSPRLPALLACHSRLSVLAGFPRGSRTRA